MDCKDVDAFDVENVEYAKDIFFKQIGFSQLAPPKSLNELSHGILSYFGQVQSCVYIEGNLKILDYQDTGTPER